MITHGGKNAERFCMHSETEFRNEGVVFFITLRCNSNKWFIILMKDINMPVSLQYKPLPDKATAKGLILQNGDKLSRSAFMHRYEAMTNIKAERIEGVVYMASPVRATLHGAPHSQVVGWLGHYEAFTSHVSLFDNSTVHLDLDNDPQPDALLRFEQEVGGQSYISEKDYIVGAPELIVEIAASTASYDLHDKLNVYRRNGVKEYLVWRVYDEAFDWFILDKGEYHRLVPNSEGIIQSSVFVGLWLDVEALLNGNLAKVIETVSAGVQSSEHKSFVVGLEQKLENN